jgi:hypothetical protein
MFDLFPDRQKDFYEVLVKDKEPKPPSFSTS